ncbi:MAG: hypothetical protein K5666_04165 [Bacilli bacterium]|nr:hypothetical protein [Bacilli bacterium]
MKRVFNLLLVITVLVGSIFVLSGCKKEEKKDDKTVEISFVHGNGTFKVRVPKKEDGTAKYEFTKEKPDGVSKSGTFYLVTDTSLFTFATSGLSYNTSTYYKETYGEQKASFAGYLEFMKDPKSTINLPGKEEFELNGRKALRYYNRTGGSGDYKYLGYFYMVAVDDLYPGSKAEMTVNYKDTDKPTETKEFDEETLSIIKSLKIDKTN